MSRRLSMKEIVLVTRFCEELMTPKSTAGARKTFLPREEIRSQCYLELKIEPSDTLLDTIAEAHGVGLTSLFQGVK